MKLSQPSESRRLLTKAETFPPLGGPSIAETMGMPHGTFDYRNHHAIAALFPDRESAERAIAEVKESSRYAPADIGVAIRDRPSEEQITEETDTQAFEAAGIGGVSGALLGGLAGWLIAVGIVAIPGVGPVISGGSLGSALGVTVGTAAAGAGLGAVAGGLAGTLIGLRIPQKKAALIDEGFCEEGIVVTVRSPDLGEAAAILRRHSGSGRASGSIPPTLINT